jgi:crossover junction endodeoxyribonuclease RuvC
MIHIGIDPGLDGAVAIREDDEIKIFDTPTFTIKNGKKKKRLCDSQGMASILSPYVGKDVHVALEKVHSMPGQGVASMFSMGEGLGIWKGLIAMAGFQITLITPQSWKKKLMQGMGKEKDAARVRAIELFPNKYEELKLKKHHGRADALLISEYLRMGS